MAGMQASCCQFILQTQWGVRDIYLLVDRCGNPGTVEIG